MVTKLVRIFGPIALGLGMWAVASAAQAATLSLSPSSQSLNIGDTLTVNIMLDTQGQPIDGVDIHYLNYNPYYLQFQGTQVTAGSLMPNTLINSVDTTNGKINFSQVTTSGTHYTGSGVLATVTFKAMVAGTANLSLDFTPGSTTDCNVASNGTDILSAVTNGAYTISYPTVTPGGTQGGSSSGNTPPTTPPSQSGTPSNLRLINDNGTFYLVIDNVLHGITNPGLLTSYGFTFSMAKPATAADMSLPKGDLLAPSDGILAKTATDKTVWLISNSQRRGFTSETVFLTLGFKFSQVLVITDPELNKLTRGANLDDPNSVHPEGVDVNDHGTIYWIGSDNQKHPYPSLAIYNSWRVPNDFTRVLPANAADQALPVGSAVTMRVLQ